MRLFLVGGAVRDLLRGAPVQDIDLAVEGDARALARSVAGATGASARAHDRFGTATVELPGGERLDFAAARRERYARPGALPSVSPASIEEDLGRRDFTVNAMALEIAPSRRLHLLDPHGGQQDLRDRRLRILHPRSFVDDPTRAYRAARYANRLGFSVERSTRAAAREAVAAGLFDTISGDRRRREIRLLFSEPNRSGAVRRLAELDLPRTLHPALAADGRALSRLARAERLEQEVRGGRGWLPYLLVWAAELDAKQALELADRLSLSGRERRILLSWPATQALLASEPLRSHPSAVADQKLSAEEIAAGAASSRRPTIRALLRESLRNPPIELAIRGRDLVLAGIEPGPALGQALAATLAARRDGTIDRDGELEFALRVARKRFR